MLYWSTLLPGVDFGDTGSFQATVGSPMLTPRAGYPLYFAIGHAFVTLAGTEPAHALNLASAVEAALACGVMVLVAIELTGSILAAAGAASLFAVSYTFWSQAVIAEVYALHLFFVSLTLLLLLRWASKPTLGRLGAFFACYALGFGNHLSMVLLAPAYAAVPVHRRAGRLAFHADGAGDRSGCAVRRRWRACSTRGNLRALWLMPEPPHSFLEGLHHFWFDVTKSDWRDTMVLNVPRDLFRDHAAMYWFDLRQQFGLIAPPLAAAGILQLAVTGLAPRVAGGRVLRRQRRVCVQLQRRRRARLLSSVAHADRAADGLRRGGRRPHRPSRRDRRARPF